MGDPHSTGSEKVGDELVRTVGGLHFVLKAWGLGSAGFASVGDVW